MTVMKVFKDSSGVIVNIGDWDYMETVEETESSILGPGGLPVVKTNTVQANPLPDGVAETTADIVMGWDGGLYEASDPRRIQPS